MDAKHLRSPIIVQRGELRIIVTLMAKALVGIDAKTGKLLWWHERDVPYDIRGEGAPPPARPGLDTAGAWTPRALREVERDHIAQLLDHTGGNKKEAARILEIDRSTLYAKLKLYELGD